MIDLTPLDVRKKKGDFRRGLRGYESAVVDEFLDLVAERLEELVRENATLRERTTQLTQTVTTFRERESAMNDALVSAQQLREEFRAQASRAIQISCAGRRRRMRRELSRTRSGRRSRRQNRRAGFTRSAHAFSGPTEPLWSVSSRMWSRRRKG